MPNFALFMKKYCDKMRNLRLYDNDAAFKAHEQAAGGDGNETVTVVPGVSMTKTERKRYFNPHDNSILVYNVKTNYYIGGALWSTGYSKVKGVSGISTEAYVRIKQIGNMRTVEPFQKVNLPWDSSSSISADCMPNKYVKCTYNVTAAGQSTKIYHTRPDGVYAMLVDGVSKELSPNYTFETAGKHEIVFCFTDSYKYIYLRAFSACTALDSVEISDGFNTIQASAFTHCTNLTSITMPESITTINAHGFSYCTRLSSITCNALTAPVIYNNTFYNVKSGGKLYYPQGSNYSIWLGGSSYYLGYYSWTSQEI